MQKIIRQNLKKNLSEVKKAHKNRTKEQMLVILKCFNSNEQGY